MTVLVRAKDVNGEHLSSHAQWERVFTFKQLKQAHRVGLPSEQLKKKLEQFQAEYSILVEGRPAFIWVSYYEEPVIVEVRMISRNEYEYIREQEEAEIRDAMEAYGERKWQC